MTSIPLPTSEVMAARAAKAAAKADAAAGAARNAAPAAAAGGTPAAAAGGGAKAAASAAAKGKVSVTPNPALPVVCIVIGMAGSGKTTLMQRLNAYVHEKKVPSYVINLDPAVAKLPYGANIDIRDTVNYKEVMKQYSLGPNGGILTSLNLFATRFDQVLGFVEKRAPALKNIFVDTPGQIEIFTWSASGSIIADSLAAAFPTVLVYVVDTPRNTNPITFMSNMMYACSIMYKTKLPFLIVFNKTDVMLHDFAVRWMADRETFDAALKTDQTYMSSLTRSMSLVLTEFYHNIRTVGVSAASGAGMPEFFKAVEELGREYWTEYRPMLAKRAEEKQQKESERIAADLKRLQRDIADTQGQEVALDARAGRGKPGKKRAPAGAAAGAKAGGGGAAATAAAPATAAAASAKVAWSDAKSAPAVTPTAAASGATATASGAAPIKSALKKQPKAVMSTSTRVAAGSGSGLDADYNDPRLRRAALDGPEAAPRGAPSAARAAAGKAAAAPGGAAAAAAAAGEEDGDEWEDVPNQIGAAPGERDGDDDDDEDNAHERVLRRAADRADRHDARGARYNDGGAATARGGGGEDGDEGDGSGDDGEGDAEDGGDEGEGDSGDEDLDPEERSARRNFRGIPIAKGKDQADAREFEEFMRHHQANAAAKAAATLAPVAPPNAAAGGAAAAAASNAAASAKAQPQVAAPATTAAGRVVPPSAVPQTVSVASGSSNAAAAAAPKPAKPASKFKAQAAAGTAPKPSAAAMEADRKAAAAAGGATAAVAAAASPASAVDDAAGRTASGAVGGSAAKPKVGAVQPNVSAAKAKGKMRTQFLPADAKLPQTAPDQPRK